MSEYKERILKMLGERKELLALEDGFFYYWPNQHGALSATDLRIIAEELDRRNETVQANLDAYFDSQR